MLKTYYVNINSEDYRKSKTLTVYAYACTPVRNLSVHLLLRTLLTEALEKESSLGFRKCCLVSYSTSNKV